MAANPGLSFKKVASKPTSGMTQGEIYFVTGDKTIYVATDATNLAPFYGGNVKNVTISHKSDTDGKELNYLTIDLFEANTDGLNPIILDFSDIASMSNVDDLINALNIYGYTDDAKKTKYTFFKGKAGWETQFDGGEEYVYAELLDEETINLTSTYNGAVKVSGIETPADSAEGDTYSSYAANKGYVDSTVNALTPDLTREEVKDTAGNVQVHYYVTLSNGQKTNIDDVVAYFIKDGMIQDAELVTTAETGITVPVPYIKLTFNTDAGSQVIRFSVKDLVDVYTAGNAGIKVDGYKINLKLQEVDASKNILKIDNDGLKINTYDDDGQGHFTRARDSEDSPWTLKINTTTEKNRIQDVIDTLNITGDNSSSYKPGTIFTGYAGWIDSSDSSNIKYLTVEGNAKTGTISFVQSTEAGDNAVKLMSVATPTNGTDAANKSYVDSKVSSALIWATWS